MRLFALLLMTMTACAQIEPQSPTVSDRPLRSMRTPTRTGGIIGSVDQSNLDLTVTASHACRLREDRVVRRTTTTEHKNSTPTGDWLLLGASVAAIGAGAVITADASKVYPKDTSSRTYNPTGPGTAKAAGIGLLAGGGLLLTIPIVDAVRASETTVTEGQVTIEGEPAGDEVACPEQPVLDAPVMLAFNEVRESLGTTGKRGVLEVNLDEALDRGVVVGKLGKGQILVGDAVVGAVQLKPLLVVREARAWAKLPRGACRTPSKPTDCEPVLAFVQQHPDGPHVAEAKQLLQESKPAIDRLADDGAWATVDVAACVKGKAEAPQDIEAACAPVASYLSRFPAGLHADEARKTNDIGQRRAAELLARLEQQVRDTEARGRRAEREAQEREQQKERRRCEAGCRLGCSSVRFRGREGICFQACVENQCNQ